MKIHEANRYNHEYLKSTDLENLFNVYLDKKNNYIFNLNSSLYFKFDKELLSKFVCKHDMHWTLVSYLIYGTTRLAWLLYKLNDVKTEDIFKIKRAGDVILYLKKAKLASILEELSKK